MIPKIQSLLPEDFKIDSGPSKNHQMQREKEIISGSCDAKEAMIQTIYKILNTDRFMYPIYSWNFGIEINDLIGEPVSFCVAELERRITEAIMRDDRILDVTDFYFDISKRHIIVCEFVAKTIFGDIKSSKEVKY